MGLGSAVMPSATGRVWDISMPRGIPPAPNSIGINHFIHRIPGICLFFGISGGISALKHQTIGLAATHRMC